MKRKLLAGLTGLTLCASLLAGCQGQQAVKTDGADTKPQESAETASADKEAGGKKANSGEKKTIKFLSIWPEDKDNAKLIVELTEEYKKDNPNFDMEFEYISSQDLTSKVKVLLASNDLPDVFAYESGAPLEELINAGAVLNVGNELEKLGMKDSVDEGALSLLNNLVNGKGVYALPLGLNIEGFWYNKALFEKAGVASAPQTWEELISAADKLKAAGIQPFVAGGKDRWPLTRLVNAYLIRGAGVNAMQKVVAGEKKLTDPEYVKAAQEIQNMAAKGYFGEGVTTVDQGTAVSMLMNGQGAMLYNGSWMTEDLVSDANAAGPDGVGYFNIPTVAGGAGKMDEYSMNCGNILAFAADKYDEATADWMKYVFTRMGDKAMKDYGAFKGYKISSMPEQVSTYTQIVADHIKAAKGSALWFEAKFDSKTSKIAQDTSQSLFTSEITPEQYMAEIQKAIEENKAK